ncbi:hypothetical protein Zmor_020407 [Zophobas morio]|uniref:Uncharacterized protein n=1 Tax=Zophobas morio TaxID=2755281 RepID=A0AA38I3U5_9CUCU|nr:hypothetical protein Zmor_020407 [Zophobas morio]
MGNRNRHTRLHRRSSPNCGGDGRGDFDDIKYLNQQQLLTQLWPLDDIYYYDMICTLKISTQCQRMDEGAPDYEAPSSVQLLSGGRAAGGSQTGASSSEEQVYGVFELGA